VTSCSYARPSTGRRCFVRAQGSRFTARRARHRAARPHTACYAPRHGGGFGMLRSFPDLPPAAAVPDGRSAVAPSGALGADPDLPIGAAGCPQDSGSPGHPGATLAGPRRIAGTAHIPVGMCGYRPPGQRRAPGLSARAIRADGAPTGWLPLRQDTPLADLRYARSDRHAAHAMTHAQPAGGAMGRPDKLL